jgi:adenosine deaminase
VLRDFAADGVVYLELRTTPRAMPAAGLTEAGYVQTILDAIAEYERNPQPQGDGVGVGLRTKLILSVRSFSITTPTPFSSLPCTFYFRSSRGGGGGG